MIEIRALTARKDKILLNSIDLNVENGEIYLLLYNRLPYATLLCEMFAGYQTIEEGEILLNPQSSNGSDNSELTIIHPVENADDFEPDLLLKDILELNYKRGGINKMRVLEFLLIFNLFADDLNKKVRYCSITDFKAFYLSLLLAQDQTNIIINDFVRGEDKAFELKFNGLLQELKKEGKAILYLTGDVFYAYRIADRVSFLKNGYLVPSEPIISKDFEELNAMDVYKKYLS